MVVSATLSKKPLENIVGGKEGNAAYQHIFSFSHDVFKPYREHISILNSNSFCRPQMLSIKTRLKLSFGKHSNNDPDVSARHGRLT